MNDALAPLALIGDGYKLETTLSAEALKAKLLKHSTPITKVASVDEQTTAQNMLKHLAVFRTDLEKCRVAVKEPVLALGRRIDLTAAEFGTAVANEETRLKKLLSGFALEQEAERKRIAAEARKVQEEADRKAREAEALLKKAEAPRATLATAAVAVKAAAASTAEADLFRQEATQIMAAAPAPVTMVMDVTVISVSTLYAAAPYLVDLTPRRADIIAKLKEERAKNPDFNLPGVEVKMVPKISTR